LTLRGCDLVRRGTSSPLLMGIVNVTPDSFSDGGMWNTPDKAVKHALALVDQGADMIDVGAESTRPGADPIAADEEMDRLMPVLRELLPSIDVPVSVDTMKASVAEAAVGAGASILNDVSGLSDPRMASVAASAGVPIVLMYIHGKPKTFDTDFAEGDILSVAGEFLKERISLAEDAGVGDNNIIVDPGIGFGTTHEQSMEILRNCSYFSFGRYPVLAGPSRKRFLAQWYPEPDADAATSEACLVAAASGADILRVHDVGTVAEAFNRLNR